MAISCGVVKVEANPALDGVPLLILGTKRDEPNARSLDEVCAIGIQPLALKTSFPTRVRCMELILTLCDRNADRDVGQGCNS